MMRKIFKAFTAISMGVGLAACASASPTQTSAQPAPLASPQPYVNYVVERDLVVRQTANGGATVVGSLSPGDKLTARVEDVGDNWYRLYSDSGNIGYIFGMPFRVAE